MKSDNRVFKKGSTTYYYSSLFFPKKVKEDVSILYVFVRILDDLVDSTPQNAKQFYKYWEIYRGAWQKKGKVNFINRMVALAREYQFQPEWIDAFWKSMEMDLIKPRHSSLKETEEYMYGSAEVIGLMMAKIMGLSEEALETAKKLGKAMQYANFIRDFQEDTEMGRDYLQVKDRDGFLKNIPLLISRFDGWQKEAEGGYGYLPKRYLVPIKTAAEMYKWTMRKISQNPSTVFERKVKPSKLRIILTGLILSIRS